MEVWKDVPGFEGLYQASTHGRIRSLNRTRKTPGATRKNKGRILKPGLAGQGYAFVSLSRYNVGKSDYIHRIIWRTFKGPIPVDWEINHIDCDRTNNHLKNLEVGSRQHNFEHAMRNGLNKICHAGTKNPASVLDDWDIRNIRFMYARGNTTMKKLAKKFRVCIQTICNIVNRNGWKHVP